MASRTAQKQQARQHRLAEQRARAEQAESQRRLRVLGGAVLVAAAVVAVAVAISLGGSEPPKVTGAGARRAAASVMKLLDGIPQSGNTLGSPGAKVTVTEFADLKCPICHDFAVGPESQIITNDVRTGKVKLVFRSFCTATCTGPQPGVFTTEHAAAYAAGLQGKAWNYILLFYNLQGEETTSYVNSGYLDGLARLISGLDYSKWGFDSGQPSLTSQVKADEALARSKGFSYTPTVVVQGPKGSAQPIVGGGYDYGTYQSAIDSVT
jgi:protein-disulfide isomerase